MLEKSLIVGNCQDGEEPLLAFRALLVCTQVLPQVSNQVRVPWRKGVFQCGGTKPSPKGL